MDLIPLITLNGTSISPEVATGEIKKLYPNNMMSQVNNSLCPMCVGIRILLPSQEALCVFFHNIGLLIKPWNRLSLA